MLSGSAKNLSLFLLVVLRWLSGNLLHQLGFLQSFHRKISAGSPFCSRDVPEMGGNQHQCLVAIRKCISHRDPSAHLPHDPFQRIVGLDPGEDSGSSRRIRLYGNQPHVV